jgi:hypothetical protein
VPFEELEVARNFANLRQMRRFTANRQVPVCVLDDQVVVGFDPLALKNLLAPGEKFLK